MKTLESTSVDTLFLVTLYGYVCVLFVIDQVVPLGVAIGFLYALAIIPAVFLVPDTRAIQRLTGFSIALIIAGYLASNGDHLDAANLTNLVLGISCNIVWAFFCNLYARETRRLEATEAALKQSNKELSEYAFIASHDLQAPVRHISAFSDFLAGELDSQPSSPSAREYLDTIQESAGRMTQLIQSILEFSRVGNQALTITSFEMGGVVEDVVKLHQPGLDDMSANVTMDSYSGQILADRPRIARVLQNLVGNSLKFMREGTTPKIEVSVHEEGEFWRIEVQDNGIGVKPEYRRRIFGAFQRLHTAEEYSGTGIGLAICAKIVNMHGGRIWLETNEKQGSCFVFTLPKTYDGQQTK
jgi:light-regulated signal transduction histidine kinase (bacteriophytochrome)